MTRSTKWLIIAIIVIIILLFIRMKAFAPAGIISGLLALAVLVQRVLVVLTHYNVYKSRRGHANNTRPENNPSITHIQALEILGLKEGASKKDIHAAYKRLIARNHPDQGGTDYLASQINAARDLLLKEKKK